MGNLKTAHIVEAVLWLLLAGVLYAYSFGFDRGIEIYKFGATGWPRAVLLLIAIAAVGQLAYHWKVGAGDAVSGDGGAAPRHATMQWYLWTFFLLALPLAYLILPQSIASWVAADKAALHLIKIGCAGGLILLYVIAMRGNLVGAMLALPIFFGVLMQDFGFYSLSPFFAVGVMYLMGERRPGWLALVTAIIIGLVLLLFVSVLYVGLPTGNISPFYDIGTGLVTLLQ